MRALHPEPLKGLPEMIDVTDVSGKASVTVTVTVTGAPAVQASYRTRSLDPRHISIKYTYHSEKVDGWTEHHWIATDVVVNGPRILKPAPDGTQRLGAETLRYAPMAVSEAPEWLRKLMVELRPSGEVTMAGV